METLDQKQLSILRILKESDRPLSGAKITSRLAVMGQDVKERTIRYYLASMDRKGYTENHGKKGRTITEKGLREASAARVIEKIGFLAARIDQMTYRMNFDPVAKTGTVVVNMSLLARADLKNASHMMKKVFAAGYAMGRLMTLFHAGERVGETTVPEGLVGIGTVCSVTVNGVLLAHGIPVSSRFGGLLELKNGKPARFVELIQYDGTTVDPLEVFIGNRMTDYTGAVKNGNGRIGVGFRELPSDSRARVMELADVLTGAGLGSFLTVGWPGQPLLDIPVSEGRLGAVVIGGLNPVAILVENGFDVRSRALSAIVDYKRLFPYDELEKHIG
jgi:HTH-type transcriptional regulator, global nitrogen regulator NrpRI